METVLWILGIAAAVGAGLALLGGGKKEDVTAGAVGGAFFASGCLIQLLFYGLMAFAGLWLVAKIFF